MYTITEILFVRLSRSFIFSMLVMLSSSKLRACVIFLRAYTVGQVFVSLVSLKLFSPFLGNIYLTNRNTTFKTNKDNLHSIEVLRFVTTTRRREPKMLVVGEYLLKVSFTLTHHVLGSRCQVQQKGPMDYLPWLLLYAITSIFPGNFFQAQRQLRNFTNNDLEVKEAE